MHPCIILFLFSAVANALPTTSDLRGLDVAYPQNPPNFWSCVYNNGYTKVAIKGFKEACYLNPNAVVGPKGGGKINDNFTDIYWAARNAGYDWRQIDTYMFPCTDDTDAKHPCMSVQDQIKVFTDFLVRNKIEVNTIWLDIEKENGECRSWMRDSKGNLELAQHWILEIRKDMASGRKWGIYAANSGWTGWANIFGNNDVPIARDLPLWVVQSDLDPRLDVYSPHIGGWDFATAKQWHSDSPKKHIAVEGCGGSVDLDTFAYRVEDLKVPAHHLGPQTCKTTVDGLRYRTCQYANASCVVMGQYPIGTMVGLSCQVVGDQVVGDWTTSAWGKTNDGYYVSLAYIDQSCGKQLLPC